MTCGTYMWVVGIGRVKGHIYGFWVNTGFIGGTCGTYVGCRKG